MTSDDRKRPGRATSPAFAYPVQRDFDGGLLRRWTFVLTRADALAYLRLRREWTGRAKAALAATSLAGGAIWALSPMADAGVLAFLATESVLIGAVMALRDVMRRIRAAQLVPVPRPGVLEEWIDCIAGSEIEGTEDAYMSPELIGEVILTRRHLFIRSHSTTLVVPRTAFASAAAAEQVAADIRSLARGPYYFDVPLDAAPPAL